MHNHTLTHTCKEKRHIKALFHAVRYPTFKHSTDNHTTDKHNRKPNRNLKMSLALLKSQAQGTSFFPSAATNQRGFQRVVHVQLRSVFQMVRGGIEVLLRRMSFRARVGELMII